MELDDEFSSNKAKEDKAELMRKQQIELEELERKREQQLREEHNRRIEAENRKKRKIANRMTGSSSKLKKMALNVFGDDDDEESKSSKLPPINPGDHDVEGYNYTQEVSNENIKTTNTLSEETIQVILKTASWVSSNPDKLDVLLENSKNNPKLQFLFEKESMAHYRYLEELKKLQTQKNVKEICSGANDGGYPSTSTVLSSEEVQRAIRDAISMNAMSMNNNNLHSMYSMPSSLLAPMGTTYSQGLFNSSALTGLPSLGSNPLAAALPSNILMAKSQPSGMMLGSTPVVSLPTPQSAASSEKPVEDSTSGTKGKREKRNRWGPPLPENADTSGPPASTSVVPTGLPTPLALTILQDPNMADPKYAAQIREQKELQLLESRIREAAAMSLKQRREVLETDSQLYLERLREYEELAKLDEEDEKDTVEDAERNNGVIEGGTWEHRKRAKEMLATARKNLELTMASVGKHHMADFLPEAELKKFLAKAEAKTTGGVLALDNSSDS
eukprot:gene2337-2798_t